MKMSITLRICIVLSSFCTTLSYAQYLPKPEKINQTDKNGRKQGHWIYYGADRPETHYPDTSKVEEGNYVDDRKDGQWVKYNADGTVRASGEYRNNRPFDPKIQVVRSSKVEMSDCSYSHPPVQQPIEKQIKWPVIKRHDAAYYYVAPKYGLSSYFPTLYFGAVTDTFHLQCFLAFAYPDTTFIQQIEKHSNNLKKANPTNYKTIPQKGQLEFVFTSERSWVSQPDCFGQDSMEYHSASIIMIRNISSDTLKIGDDMRLDLQIQIYENDKWGSTSPNPSPCFPIPETSGPMVVYPGEIVITAIPLFEGENRKLRIIIGDCVSEEFNIVDNQRKPKY